MTKRVLITGATGFIGRFCLQILRQKGFEVFAISSKKASIVSDGIHWIQHDLLHHSAKDLIARTCPTHLLHLAWDVTPGKFWTSRANFDWLKTSLDLLEAFALHGGKRVVMAGSCTEYDWSCTEFSEEKTPCNPHTLYGTSKLTLRLLLESYAKQASLSQAWGRIFYLYGPHEYPQRFIPAIIKGLLNKAPTPCSHCNQIRDFLHVQDVAEAFVAILDSDLQGAVNIGSGQGISLKQLIEKIADNLGGNDLIQFGKLPAQPNDPPSIIANITKLNTGLKWHPKISLDQGLVQTIAWWKEQASSD